MAHRTSQVMTNTYVVRKRLKKVLFRSKQMRTWKEGGNDEANGCSKAAWTSLKTFLSSPTLL
ncbi:MAG: hypothetical protein GDA51_08920 [Ekhidna sp.]|nr:hypothetical protein [Ekhidna sp.]